MHIDIKLIISTFIMIFLAELGDKTQLSIFTLSTHRNSVLSIFIGSISALLLTTVIAVILGGAIGKLVPQKVMKIIAGAVFISFGIITLYGALKI